MRDPAASPGQPAPLAGRGEGSAPGRAAGRPSRQSGGVALLLASAGALATFGLITLGSIVRVTGSGLGCPDWPLCHGQLLPPLEYHVLIEYSHRLLASLVSVLTVSTAVVAWWRRSQAQRLLLPAGLALAFLGMEVVLGGITVLGELPPALVTLHLATAEVVFAMLLLTALRAAPGPATRTPVIGARLRLPVGALIAAAATYLAILSGSYVVATGATAACGFGLTAWPLCNGSLVPSGFLAWANVAHRLLVLVAGLATLGAAASAWRRRGSSAGLGPVALAAIVLEATQVLAGAGVPWLTFLGAARVLHLSLATALWGSLVALATLAARSEVEEKSLPSGQPRAAGRTSRLRDYLALTKPQVISLLLVTATGGMILAAGGLPPPGIAAAVLLGGFLAAGGAGAINHALEAQLDERMVRTRQRPVASGRVPRGRAIAFGLALNVLAFLVLWRAANVLAASLAVAGSAFYILVYTMWLKRATVQNIVIGGAAGAVPPLVGWAAVTGSLGLPAFYLFAIIFFWTPPHFWALALLMKDDYERAGVPMLPVVQGEARTRRAIFLYVLLVNALALLFFVSTRSLGPLYLGGSVLLGSLFVFYAVRLLQEKHKAAALRLYRYSLLYLALLFLVVMVDGSR
ncbi:MAG: protoheme IX farnesyltransferase [Chloroflexi bacterium]|nr:protoheme IX farnesyltransferase [Chloroflexota bacterium]